MSKRAVTDANQQKTLLAERSCIAVFDHAFLVAFHGAFQDRDFVYLALEYCSGGCMEWHVAPRAAAPGP